jgi:hypothetical protein
MLQPYRAAFNAAYTPAAYAALQASLNAATRTHIDFRICETPCFFSRALLDEMADIGRILTDQLVGNPAYMQASDAAIPAVYRAANDNPQPNFMTVDFGLVRDASGNLTPKLVELQAFPSIFGYQDLLGRQYVDSFNLDPTLTHYLGGHTETSYWDLLAKVILNGHGPENVVLAEVEPAAQKTLPDFHVHEDRLGIATVDIARIHREGDRLFYERHDAGKGSAQLVPIHRIYNRAIVDEIQRKGISLPFDYRDPLRVEWAGHPNWYFRISKFSLPYLDHPSVPTAVFLDDYLADPAASRLPEDRGQLLLKPLYSFAGKGIQFAPTDADLHAIPAAERRDYLLQERVAFAPVIETPHGLTQAEVRIMYLWPDGAPMEPVISLVRMGRGLMMGVDHNRNQEWVGGSAALSPP